MSDLVHRLRLMPSSLNDALRAMDDAAARIEQLEATQVSEPRWIAVDEIGNDNFATSIYEAGYDGLLVARCNQNGQYPWQGPAIIRGLEQNKSIAAIAPEQDK